jgi:hypothetical protein
MFDEFFKNIEKKILKKKYCVYGEPLKKKDLYVLRKKSGILLGLLCKDEVQPRFWLGAGWAKPYRLDKVPACFARARFHLDPGLAKLALPICRGLGRGDALLP